MILEMQKQMISKIYNVQGAVGVVQLLAVAMDMNDADTVFYIAHNYKQAVIDVLEDGEGLIAHLLELEQEHEQDSVTVH